MHPFLLIGYVVVLKKWTRMVGEMLEQEGGMEWHPSKDLSLIRA